MPGVSPFNPKAASTNGGTFVAWKDVHGYTADGGSPQPAKKVYLRNSDNTAWVEVWNARPELSGVTTTTATHDIDESKITSSVNVVGHYLDTTVYFNIRPSGGTWTVVTKPVLTGSTIQGTQQTVTHTQLSLAENTTYEYFWYAENAGGGASATAVQSITTPYNCTEGASGFVSISCTDCVESESIGCGTCGLRTRYRYRTKYGKTGCTNTYYSAWSAYPDWSVVGCTEGGGTWVNVTNSIPETGTFAGYAYRRADYYYGFATGIYYTPSSQCGPPGTGGCCGGYAIKYFQAEQCSQTGAQRWVDPECWSPI